MKLPKLYIEIFALIMFMLVFQPRYSAQNKNGKATIQNNLSKITHDAQYLYELASLFYSKRKYDLAEILLNESVLYEPYNRKALNLLADLYLKLGKKEMWASMTEKIRLTKVFHSADSFADINQQIKRYKNKNIKNVYDKYSVNKIEDISGTWSVCIGVDLLTQIEFIKTCNNNYKAIIITRTGFGLYYYRNAKYKNGIIVLDKPIVTADNKLVKILFLLTFGKNDRYLVYRENYDKVIAALANEKEDNGLSVISNFLLKK